MKSKIFLATICMFLTTSFLKAQSKYFYYYNSEKVYIDIDKEHFTLLLDEDYNLEDFPVNLYYPFELERADEINVLFTC